MTKKQILVNYQACGAVKDNDGNISDFIILFNSFNQKIFGYVLHQPDISLNYFQETNAITGSGFVFDKIFGKELMKCTTDYIGPEYWNQNLIFSNEFFLCYSVMRMTYSMLCIGEIGYWHNFDNIESTSTNVWKLDRNRLLNPEKSNKKILDFIIITERIMELTEEESQYAFFREYIQKSIKKFNI